MEEIYKLLIEKNEKGLVLLQEGYEKYIKYVISGILGNRHLDIEECINDTYMKVWNNIESYDINKASLETYIIVIARNTAISKLRTISYNSGNVIDGDLSDMAREYVDKKNNVEEKVLEKENIELIKNIIFNLKGEEKELIQRKYFYLQSSKDIAKAMNISQNAVDNRIYRIKAKMKKEYDRKSKPCERRTEIWMTMFL